MEIQQADGLHKRGSYNSPTTFPQFPDPQSVSFCGWEVVGERLPFSEMGGGDRALDGWGGILHCVTALDFVAMRSADGKTIYLHQRWTWARWEGRA